MKQAGPNRPGLPDGVTEAVTGTYSGTWDNLGAASTTNSNHLQSLNNSRVIVSQASMDAKLQTLSNIVDSNID